MRLSEFIRRRMEDIVAEWETFAASLLPAAAGMTSLALRDHAPEMLEAVAADLETCQTREEQWEKSQGRAPQAATASATAAQTHAVLRARSGFDVNQLVAEYRALRASVLRLWMDAHTSEEPPLQDIVRFNEAIDQAVAESVGHYQGEVERARNLLLGMLGHDMRSPLNTIVTTASCLAALNAGELVSMAASRLIRSGAAMQALLDDLVDFNRAKLGLGIRVAPDDVDLAAIFADELEQLRGAHPHCLIAIETRGDMRGRWDGRRMQQVLRNLVSNAIKFGHPGRAVRVSLRGEENHLLVEVTNEGPPIDAAAIARIFDPLHRGSADGVLSADRDGLGLGLFIVREIAGAHGAKVEVRCADGHTTFAVVLPRRAVPVDARPQDHEGPDATVGRGEVAPRQ